MKVNPRALDEWHERMSRFLGPSLERFALLDEAQARRWSARREELLQRGRGLGLKSHEGSCAHLYTGELSPGCRACTEGSWSCLFLNGRCNRRCFYCPQELNKKQSRPPFEGSFHEVFRQPEEYIVFLRGLNYRGMSLSGGEPFLSFQTMTDFIGRTREALGSEIYIWAYTNGSLYTPERGKQLAEAGLDELRFDISANDYDLDAAGAAVDALPTVAVEIPAVPEDKDRVLALLPRIEELGIGFLNLHQLYTTRNNREALADRRYTLIRDQSPAPPILESEICALEIMCEALERGIRLPINYCSNTYKIRFQSRGTRRRLAELVTRSGLTPETGTPTAEAMFRQLVIPGPAAENRILVDRFRRDGAAAGDYTLAADQSAVYVHPKLLDHPGIAPRHVFVYYHRYEVQREACTECSCQGQPIENGGGGPEAAFGDRLQRVGPVGQLELHHEIARLGFQKLFIQQWSVPRTLRFLTARYFAGARKRGQIEHSLQQMHHYGRGFEYMDPSFAPYA